MNTIKSSFKALFSNLKLAARQALFLKIDFRDYCFDTEQVILLALFNMSFIILCTYLIYLPAPEFNDYAVTGFAFTTSLLLLTAFVVERFFIKKHQFLIVATLFISLDTVFSFPGLLSYWLVETYQYDLYDLGYWYWYLLYGLSIIILIWFLISLLRAVHLYTPLSKLKYVAIGLIIFVLYFIPASYFSEQMGTFWYASYDEDSAEEENPYDKVNVEDVFYQQFEMIYSLNNDLLKERQDKTDLYFLGFSSYATQDVFYKEVKYAKNLMDSRFDTSGRSALLINHLKTYETEPLANTHNLKIMLDGMSEHMNVEQDILFLYLTSHGGKKHNLSVDFWPLDLNDLTPEVLKKQLDDSGIKWRVIVVSSCYSGGYIKPLEDDHTLIFTASAADKQSFGCSNENEFTWFGEAIFKFALNKNTSFIDAFEQAKRYIQDKEKAEKVEASLPQLSIGKKIADKLNQYTAELDQKYKENKPINLAFKAINMNQTELNPLIDKTVILNH